MVYTVKSWFTQICTIRTADMFSPLLVLSPTKAEKFVNLHPFGNKLRKLVSYETCRNYHRKVQRNIIYLAPSVMVGVVSFSNRYS